VLVVGGSESGVVVDVDVVFALRLPEQADTSQGGHQYGGGRDCWQVALQPA
jgi:hypothetical protein